MRKRERKGKSEKVRERKGEERKKRDRQRVCVNVSK